MTLVTGHQKLPKTAPMNTSLKWLALASLTHLLANILWTLILMPRYLMDKFGGFLQGQVSFLDSLTTYATALSVPVPFWLFQLGVDPTHPTARQIRPDRRGWTDRRGSLLHHYRVGNGDSPIAQCRRGRSSADHYILDECSAYDCHVGPGHQRLENDAGASPASTCRLEGRLKGSNLLDNGTIDLYAVIRSAARKATATLPTA
jgi:hypothetical protein